MIDLFISLVKGLDKKFGDHTEIGKLGPNKVVLKILSGTSDPDAKTSAVRVAFTS